MTWNKDYLAQQKASTTTAAAAAESADVTGFLRQTVRSAFVCGLSGAEANGNVEFVFLPCGHVFAAKALRETAHLTRVSTATAILGDGDPATAHTTFACPECNVETSTEHVLPLAPPPEVQDLLLQVVLKRRAAAKARKAAKRQRSGTSTAASAAKKPRAAAAVVAMPPGASSIVAAAAAKAAAASAGSKALAELLHKGREAGQAAMTTGAELSKGFIGGGV